MNAPSEDGAPARRGGDLRVGLVLAAVLATLSLATAADMGLTWDEAYYQYAAERQRDWLGLLLDDPATALGEEAIERHWNYDPYHNPHPPFYKIAINLGRAVTVGWMDEVAASRATPALFYGMTAALLFGLVRRSAGRAEALGAALLWATMPRVFAHGHVGATDIFMSAFAVASAWLFLAALERRWLALPLGAVFGAAFATKFTAVLLPVPLALWALATRERRAIAVLAIAGVTTPLVAIAFTPYWWHHPVAGIAEFIRVSTHREEGTPISVVYWGVVYGFRAPWHFPWVMLALATPIGSWAPALATVVRGLRTRFADRDALLFVLAFLVPIGVVTLPSSPKHDGLRMFLPALPFLAALSARGVRLLLEGGRGERAFPALLAGLVAAQAGAVALYHPHQLSYYNVLIGGLRGAERAGLEVSYWMEGLTPEVLEDLNELLPPGTRLSVVPGDPFYFQWLQHLGRLREDLIFYDAAAAPGDVDVGLATSRVSMLGTEGMDMLDRTRQLYRYPADPDSVPFVRVVPMAPPAGAEARP